MGPPMIRFVSSKKGKQGAGVSERISEAYRRRTNLRVMPDEMEKLIRELPRDTEIVALFKAESATNV